MKRGSAEHRPFPEQRGEWTMTKRWSLMAGVLLLAVLAAGCQEGGTNVDTTGGVSNATEEVTAGTVAGETLESTTQTDAVEDTTTATGSEDPIETTEATVPINIEVDISDWEDPVESTSGEETQAPAGGNSGTSKPTEDTEPTEEPEPTETSKPTEPTQEESTRPELLTYEEYDALTPEEKQAYFESFATVEEFYAWLEAAEEESGGKPNNTTGGDKVDIGDYIKP